VVCLGAVSQADGHIGLMTPTKPTPLDRLKANPRFKEAGSLGESVIVAPVDGSPASRGRRL
jgi:hypothetical protein